MHGQTSKFNSACDAIKFFLSSSEVTRNFKNENKNDSLLLIVDLAHALDSCNIFEWRGKRISKIREGPLYDSIKLFRLFYVTDGRTNIYSFYISNASASKGYFAIQYGRNNVLSQVNFIKKKNKYYLERIRNGVE